MPNDAWRFLLSQLARIRRHRRLLSRFRCLDIRYNSISCHYAILLLLFLSFFLDLFVERLILSSPSWTHRRVVPARVAFLRNTTLLLFQYFYRFCWGVTTSGLLFSVRGGYPSTAGVVRSRSRSSPSSRTVPSRQTSRAECLTHPVSSGHIGDAAQIDFPHGSGSDGSEIRKVSCTIYPTNIKIQ